MSSSKESEANDLIMRKIAGSQYIQRLLDCLEGVVSGCSDGV